MSSFPAVRFVGKENRENPNVDDETAPIAAGFAVLAPWQ